MAAQNQNGPKPPAVRDTATSLACNAQARQDKDGRTAIWTPACTCLDFVAALVAGTGKVWVIKFLPSRPRHLSPVAMAQQILTVAGNLPAYQHRFQLRQQSFLNPPQVLCSWIHDVDQRQSFPNLGNQPILRTRPRIIGRR